MGTFCKGGGCTAKLGAGAVDRILGQLPRPPQDPDLLIGYDSRDDAAVYRLSPDLAVVQTLDFFPPMVEDPYVFGQIAAANALNDIWAMGGRPVTALNIVSFPEKMDLDLLGEILRGGAEKVEEAGASLAGGHSIGGTDVLYGLSVTGTVHPDRIWANDRPRPGDALVLTKALGTGLICSAARAGEAPEGSLDAAVASMRTLDRGAAEVCWGYPVHACTDVTGFGLLGHLHEMLGGPSPDGPRASCVLWTDRIPVLPGARACAEAYLFTAAAQRTRNWIGDRVRFEGVSFAMEEVLFDPQTSGGLLAALPMEEAEDLVRDLRGIGLPAAVIGRIGELDGPEIRAIEGGRR